MSIQRYLFGFAAETRGVFTARYEQILKMCFGVVVLSL
jgi:hypothetical protein